MKHFCVVPWYSREIDLVNRSDGICCWLTSNIDRPTLQRKFLAGERAAECKKCWQAEERGAESRRQMENRFLDHKANRDLSLLAQDAEQGQAHLSLYQITVGTTCNGTCVTCNPIVSSAWRHLLQSSRSAKQESESAQKNHELLLNDVDWTKILRVNLLGGEPFLINQTYEILERLLMVGNTDCRVSIVTNGSIRPNDDLRRLAQHFTDISCCVSIDGIGPVFEYLRYPLRWDLLVENLKIYKTLFKTVEVSYTVSNLNYHTKADTIKWFNDNDLLYIENFVISPAWFNYKVHPGHDLWPKFKQVIQHQDQLKGISIDDYIPYMGNLIKTYDT